MRVIVMILFLVFGHCCNAQKLSLAGKVGISFAQSRISERTSPEPLFGTPYSRNPYFSLQLLHQLKSNDFIYLNYRFQGIAGSYSALSNTKQSLVEAIIGESSSAASYDFKSFGLGYKKDLFFKNKPGKDFLAVDLNIAFFNVKNFLDTYSSSGQFEYLYNLEFSLESGKKVFPYLSVNYSHNFLNRKGREIFGFDFNYSYSPVKFATSKLTYYNVGPRYPSAEQQKILFTNRPNAFTFSFHKTIRIIK